MILVDAPVVMGCVQDGKGSGDCLRHRRFHPIGRSLLRVSAVPVSIGYRGGAVSEH
jgi:hypothetical protein